MQYTEKFKEEMVRKMVGPGAMSAYRLAQECGVSQTSLSKWRREAMVGAVKKPSTGPLKKRWNSAEKLRVLMAAARVGDKGLGELLRSEGLHESDLKRFEQELSEDSKSTRKKSDPGDKKRIKELEREVRRKDKALAEATALVVLSKKLNAYFEGVEVGDTEND